jgi:3-hydroxypropanoate dehydrogenase
MPKALDAAALDQLFREARTRNAWQAETLADSVWRDLYGLVRTGPTAINSSPGRFRFLTTEAAKRRLEPLLAEGNRAKTMTAPCVVIIGYDLDFYEKFDVLFPARAEGLKTRFAASPDNATLGLRNSSLEGAYLILAARSLGLDAGPMSGFDNAGVDAEFFAGTSIKSNFICALGHGADEPFPRLPRLDFEDACQIL